MILIQQGVLSENSNFFGKYVEQKEQTFVIESQSLQN